MPLELPNRQLRGALDLRELVKAVLAATADDESFFIEWKSSLDVK